MTSMPTECPVPSCSRGPCRTAARLILAEAAEVPVGCPNRIEITDPAEQLPHLLSSTDLHTTPRADELISIRPGRGRRSNLIGPLTGGRLVLLEQRVRHPIREGGGGKRPIADTPDTPITPVEEKTWVAISLVDEEGNPVPGEPYEIVVPGGRVIRGSLDANGKARVTGIDPGICPVTFPRLDAQSWDRVERHPPRPRPPVPDEPPEVEPEDPDEGVWHPDDSIDPLETADIEQREQEELEAWNRQREQEAEEDGSGEAGQQQAQDDG